MALNHDSQPGTPALEPGLRYDLTATLLGEFKTLQSSDLVKTDLELTHIPCGEHLCDVEDDDTMLDLLGMVAAHVCEDNQTGGTQR
jgi:hypothetical protein